MKRILAILAKEFLDLRRNPRLWFGVFVVPILVAAFMLPGMMGVMGGVEKVIRQQVAAHRAAQPKVPKSFAQRPEPEVRMPPGLDKRIAKEPPERQLIWFFVSMMIGYLFLYPVALPLSLGSGSIVGEKQEGTLEPLLATPVRTSELLIAKTLFAAFPGIVVTWIAYGAYLYTAGTILPRKLVLEIFASGGWLLALFGLTPILAFTTTLALVTISAWVTDPRTAQQYGAMLMLPIVGLIPASMLGLVQLDTLLVWAIPPAALTGLGMLRVAVKTFHRDAILTRWK